MNRNPYVKPALFRHAEQALREILAFAAPADSLLSGYFRVYRELGHADRAFIAETVFAVLRRKRSLEAACAGRPSPRRLLLSALVCARGWEPHALESLLKPGELDWLVAARTSGNTGFPPAVCRDWPDWLDAALVGQYGPETSDALAEALKQPAPLDLRVNSLKIDRAQLLAEFAAAGLAATPGELSPLAVRLAGKPALTRHPRFIDGSFEVQDEGSQLLGLLLAPKRGEMVVDFCAGAGGKTLLLGALMKNSGRLYALDVSERRLAKLKPRLARSGLSNVHPVRIEHERDVKVKRLAGKVDRVLVDAPCSGLGTLRRNPDLKWRQSPTAVAELVAKQTAILAAASGLLKPGGRLVYATCSLLREENDAVVDAFLETHPQFRSVSVGEILMRQGIALAGERLQLLPHVHQTDGFFAAILERDV